MGVSRSVLIEEAASILQKPLKELGYKFEPSPPNEDLVFWFEKWPQSPSDIFFCTIEFQPSGFELDNGYFQMAINLYRRTERTQLGPRIESGPAQIPALRVMPRLWGETGPGSGHDVWWHFVSTEQLREAYTDILEKLRQYAIPFLEDPKSTWLDAMGL